MNYQFDDFFGADICLDCGVLVASRTVHDNWHAAMSAVAQKADRADTRTRPMAVQRGGSVQNRTARTPTDRG